ncbi:MULTISPECIES: YbaN family protein [Pseudoalteromonas]|uniref:YbaN family protein n=1 Tax=Pseudoalteromonas TaxID=53246 RepID=UPI000824E113|nr:MULTISPECIES: YbaN family protein [Pseudoalteromonas]
MNQNKAFTHYKNTALKVCGYLFVSLGIAGVFLPVMPTTVFLIIALACFNRASPTLAEKLLNHPRFGETLRLWQKHKLIPIKAKMLAIMGISVSYLMLLFTLPSGWLICTVGIIKVLVIAYILSRPSKAAYC